MQKLTIVVSHPIQHFIPFYKALETHPDLDLTVVFCSRIGLQSYFDEDMNVELKWNMDLQSGFNSVFLAEADTIETTDKGQVNNPSIKNTLSELSPDIILVYGYTHKTMRMALDWANKNSVPTIMISDSELKDKRPFITRLLKKLILPIIYKKVTAFITVGDENEKYYRHYGVSQKRLFRSPFTIDETLYIEARKDKKKHRARYRNEWGLSENHHLSLTVGKINDRKRTSDILDVAELIMKKGNSNLVHFLIAGNGQKMHSLKERADANNLPVTFLDFVNVDKLPSIYAACDFITHPSSKDPHPLILSEASCVGLPLIVSDKVGATGATDIARENQNTLVFPVGDIKAIYDSIFTLLSTQDKLEDMSNRALEIFEDQNINRSVNGLMDAVEYCTR